MSADEHLSPLQFYHGTTHDIEGGYVLPSSHPDNPSSSNWDHGPYGHLQDATKHAFATSDEEVAWQFAGAIVAGAIGRRGRTRVYEVAPHPSMRPGVGHRSHPSHLGNDEDLREYVAPKLRVKRRIDIMPGHQGTFPEVDWNMYAPFEKRKAGHGWRDANHPEPGEEALVMNDLQREANDINDRMPKPATPSMRNELPGVGWNKYRRQSK